MALPSVGVARRTRAVLSREFEDSPSVWERRRVLFLGCPAEPDGSARGGSGPLTLGEDGRAKSAQQVHPPGFRPVEDPAVEEEGWRQDPEQDTHDVAHEHLLQHVR